MTGNIPYCCPIEHVLLFRLDIYRFRGYVKIDDMKKRLLSLFVAGGVVLATFAQSSRNAPWSKERAWEWHRSHEWVRGCNYMSASCANRIDQWQGYGFEERFAEAEKELALAEEIGFNSMRVVLAESGFGVWMADHDGFMERFERTIDQFDRHGMTVAVVLGNDCTRPKELWKPVKLGPQTCDWGYHGGRKVSQHGSLPDAMGWSELDDLELKVKFFAMCREIVGKYRDDRRILFWNVYNEPGNNNRAKITAPNLKELFALLWKIDPIQPLAADIWYDGGTIEESAMNEAVAVAGALSDIISYHCYGDYLMQTLIIHDLRKRYGRPLYNTEWLHRIWRNDVFTAYPLYFLEGVGCYMWGFVAGKYQTYEPWEGIWRRQDEGVEYDLGLDVTKWQHDLIRPSMRPYDPREVRLIKRINALADREADGGRRNRSL